MLSLKLRFRLDDDVDFKDDDAYVDVTTFKTQGGGDSAFIQLVGMHNVNLSVICKLISVSA